MKTTLAALLATLAAAILLAGQPVSIPPGDPDVFAAFLRMHHAIVSTTGPTGSSSSSTGAPSAKLTGTPPSSEGWQQELGLKDADFSKIEPAYSALQSKLDSLRSEALAYATSRTANPDPATLQSFRDREIALIKTAMANLKSQLSPAGSAALFTFIDGRFRASVSRVPIGNVK